MPNAAEQLTRFKEIIATPKLPTLGPQRRGGTKSEAEILRALNSFFRDQKLSDGTQPLLRSAALLWHDHLDASHTISQGIETREGSWLHGIMHRREPDYGNAEYWFRRVLPHQAFPELVRRVTTLLEHDATGLTKRLIENGEWKPMQFIDECERAEQKNDAALDSTLRKIQAAEFDVLVDSIFQNA
jgi:hypothetical protein